MASLRKTLRPYQARLIADVCRSDGHVLVEQPTGSGKTMQVVTLVAMQLGRRFSHAVIAAPQQQIEEGFTDLEYRYVGFPACQGAAAPDIEVPEHFVWGARNSKQLSSTKRLIAYLRQPGPCDHALACTHAALNCLDLEKLPADLSGKALFIDEAHHASADGLSELVTLWRDRGGRLYFFTATPYRGDGRPVALDDMRLYRRSLAEHMAEGFAPRHLESEIVALGRRGDKVSAGQFTGEEAPPDWNEVVNGVCRRWTDEGRPKTIVRVPPMRGGSAGRVAVLIRALQSQGARVLDATGTGMEDKKRFLTALKAEMNRSHAESRFDVVVGIQRVMEGTDWPVCSAVYCVGMPGSLNTVVQLLGRAMRPKNPDYPEQQRDRARLVFFVPCAGGAALPELSIDHSRHALLTCCFLADHEVGQEWIVLKEIRRGIADVLGSPEQNPAAAEAENDAAAPLDPEVRAEVELVLADAREQIIGQGREPTLSDVVQQAMQARQDLPESAFRQVAVEVLAGQGDAEGARAREAVRGEVARRLRIQPEIKQAMEDAFAAVLNEFRDATLQKSAVLESVGRQVHGVTGGLMREFAQRLRGAIPRPLTELQILAWADDHHGKEGQWPMVESGPICDASGETWANVDNALRAGTRGLPGRSSLPQLLAERRGARNMQDLPPLTKEQILAWADAQFDRTRQWPNRTSGPIGDYPGETWVNVDQAMKKGLRGLHGPSSLARLLAKERGVRNVKGLAPLALTQILAWADAHKERTGMWPRKDSGPIPDAPGETWTNVDAALLQGCRGLPGKSTLAQLLAKERGVRNPFAAPPLCKEQILTWADAHFERTGHWPNKGAGCIVDAPGETWGAIDDALRRGSRGLPGNSSLADLLADERGVRNRLNLPDLTNEQVLAWADAHRQRFGEWPVAASGPVYDNPGEKWANINAVLYQGGRGLPGGSSLARLLASERGVRNLAALPPLAKDQILGWADAHFNRTGQWPTATSGPIEEASDEKWRNVQNALQIGLRGLPGDSSLAQLLAEERGVRNLSTLPLLTRTQILAWADAHRESTGKWPTTLLGSITEAPHETWANVSQALKLGLRGLPGGSSLAKLLAEERGARNPSAIPPLTKDQILAWVDAHFSSTGSLPDRNSGDIADAPGEKWVNVESALRLGLRGLPGGSSLARLIKDHRGEILQK